MVANLRLVLAVEVKPGTDTAASHSAPGLSALLARLPKPCWPEFIRGDSDWGVDGVMRTAESKQLHYLFKLRIYYSYIECAFSGFSMLGISFPIQLFEGDSD
jgi:hypothetical protein